MGVLRRLRPETLRSKSSVAIIVTVAVLIELISTGQYLFARKGIREEVERRAEVELQVKNLEIQKVMVAVETAMSNTVWVVENSLDEPDSLYGVLRRMVEQNQTIVGAGLMFTPDYYPEKGRWFEPYVTERTDGGFDEAQIGGASHDYLEAEFYKSGINATGGNWSEPYYDDTGAKMMLCTYTMPVRDSKGQTVALLGADVSLGWLSNVINASHIYPSSYNIMISRTGKVMVCPVDSFIMRRTIQEIAAMVNDATAQYINKQMMSGQSGRSILVDNDGEKHYVFYAPVDGNTGWSMSIVCNDKEIFAGLRRVGRYSLLLLLAGMALLCFIIYRTARSARSLHEATVEKERISSELHIARRIQESMIPKIFPPYPDRKDVDIYASLLPAKEVGGDLYDFYIRDEKLFFCIGDVSGKGVPASLLMAVTRSLFRITSAHEDLPENIVTSINEAMSDMNESNMFVTLFVGVLDLADGQLLYCNAGHDEPLLIGKGVGTLKAISNIPVGVIADWKYEGQQRIINPKTTIFLFTDGLTEAENTAKEQFGEQRVVVTARGSLNSDGICNPEIVIAQQADALNMFVGEAEQSDDLTMLAIRYNAH